MEAHGSDTLPFVIPSEAEGSAVLQARPGNVFRGSGLGFEARRADRQTLAQPGQGWGIDFPTLSERRRRGTLSPQPASVLCRKTFPGGACRTERVGGASTRV
jgi:hypothetical protein